MRTDGGTVCRYNVTVRFVPDGAGTATMLTSRRLGFRQIALVTGNDTNATWVAENENSEGNGDLNMMFRVNGAPFAARGANMIPMETVKPPPPTPPPQQQHQQQHMLTHECTCLAFVDILLWVDICFSDRF
jgi:hypothetical protein